MAVHRPRTEQHVPREGGCVRCSREVIVQPEQRLLSTSISAYASYHVPRFSCRIHLFPPLQTFLVGGKDKDFGYVVKVAGRVTLEIQDCPFWCPRYLAAWQQQDLAC